MDKRTTFKEAIKIGLATVLAYYIAMSFAWMNPTWAAISVGMVSLPTAGQSLNKGLQRMGGTLMAFVFGLFFLSIYPSGRWLFFLAITPWLAYVGYKISGKKNQYFWFVFGFVTLMITTSAQQDSSYSFQYAVFRTLETLLGIAVWTLVSVFIWPRSNLGALKTVSQELLASVSKLTVKQRTSLLASHADEDPAIKSLLASIKKSDAELTQTIMGAASESYGVARLRPVWDKFKLSSVAISESLDKINATASSLKEVDLSLIIPNLDSFVKLIEDRFKKSGELLSGASNEPLSHTAQTVILSIDKGKISAEDYYQAVIISSLQNELMQLDTLSLNMLEYVYQLNGIQDQEIISTPSTLIDHDKSRGPLGFVPLDRDRVRVSIRVVTSLWVGAIIWIYVNPPGQQTWYQFLPNVILVVAMIPYVKFNLVKPFAYAYVVGVTIYIFIMPQLAMFWQLGLVLMAFTFAAAYFFTNSVMRTAIYLSMYNMLGIQNDQTYNVAGQFNAIAFTLMSLAVVVALTYITRGPRPEKMFLSMTHRFFRSCQYINARAYDQNSKPSFFKKLKTAYYMQELTMLPAKMAQWGAQINQIDFQNNSSEQTQAIISDFKMIAFRVKDLYTVCQLPQSQVLRVELKQTLSAWYEYIQQGFMTLSVDPGKIVPDGHVNEQLIAHYKALDNDAKELIEQAHKLDISQTETDNFYSFTEGLSSLSVAAVAFINSSNNIDWSEWREERFS